jgi:hypothetical protein
VPARDISSEKEKPRDPEPGAGLLATGVANPYFATGAVVESFFVDFLLDFLVVCFFVVFVEVLVSGVAVLPAGGFA